MQDRGGEGAADGGQTHQDRWLNDVDEFAERFDLLAGVVGAGEVDFVLGELVAPVEGDEALGRWSDVKFMAIKGLLVQKEGRAYSDNDDSKLTFESTNQKRRLASSSESPSLMNSSTICLATPTPALPAPRKTARCSLDGTPLNLIAFMIPASTTAPVPWTSSLKQVYLFRYRSRAGNGFLKSSN